VESKLGPFGTSATECSILPAPGDYDDGEFGGMKIGRGRKPAPAPLCPPQIPLDQTPGSNSGRRGGKPATNRLSYGAAITVSVGPWFYCTLTCLSATLQVSDRPNIRPTGWLTDLLTDWLAC
jgi:hypothetical protein